MKRIGSLSALSLGLLLFAGPADVQAQVKKSDAVVKIKATADKPGPDGKQPVTITLDVEAPWHLYANPVGNPDQVASQTTVAITAKVKPKEVKIDYPPGKLVKDKVVGDYKVWEGKVTIKAQVTRAKDDTSPLEITLKFQSCNDKSCLLPATVKVTVP
jgi:hypothetical protein